MTFLTTRFGEIDVSEEKVITIPDGVLGFPGRTRFLVLDHFRDAPFKWLQSLDDPDLAFVIADPRSIKDDYRPAVRASEVSDLDVKDENDLAVVVVVTVPAENPLLMTANLQGPIVVNARNRLGKQLVLAASDYPDRYPLIPDPAPARQPAVAAAS
ncbi:MAG: flagellar assembly protein FliW [Nitrospirae bacterium]|nr:flagellar assembly protein FliW [Nitrospirota bacterium]